MTLSKSALGTRLIQWLNGLPSCWRRLETSRPAGFLANEEFWVVLLRGEPGLRASGAKAGNRPRTRSGNNRDAASERLGVTPPFLKLFEVPRVQAGSEHLLTAVISNCEDINIRIR